jgi:hypothetical protein
VTRGSNPLPELDGRHSSSVPADLSPSSVSRGTLSQAIARALNQPVRVVEIDEEEGVALLVEPLHFHRVKRREGRDVVCKSHVTPNSLEGQYDHG